MKQDNIFYSDSKDVPCGRCKANDSEFICTNCDSQFKYTCVNCDNIIHSLPSKKNHKRSAVSSFEVSKQQIPNEEKNQDLNYSNKFKGNNNMYSISPIRGNPNPIQSINPMFSIQSNVSIEIPHIHTNSNLKFV